MARRPRSEWCPLSKGKWTVGLPTQIVVVARRSVVRSFGGRFDQVFLHFHLHLLPTLFPKKAIGYPARLRRACSRLLQDGLQSTSSLDWLGWKNVGGPSETLEPGNPREWWWLISVATLLFTRVGLVVVLEQAPILNADALMISEPDSSCLRCSVSDCLKRRAYKWTKDLPSPTQASKVAKPFEAPCRLVLRRTQRCLPPPLRCLRNRLWLVSPP